MATTAIHGASSSTLPNTGGSSSTLGGAKSNANGISSFYASKISQYQILINDKTHNLRRLEAQRNQLNARVRLLREEMQLLQEPGSHVGEVIKVMSKKKILVKVQPEGKYGEYGGGEHDQTDQYEVSLLTPDQYDSGVPQSSTLTPRSLWPN
jgi:26S proteasome regulatory subunit T6